MNILKRELRALCKGRQYVDVGREVGVSGGFIGAVLRGRKKPGPKLLAHLGLEAFESYRRLRPAK